MDLHLAHIAHRQRWSDIDDLDLAQSDRRGEQERGHIEDRAEDCTDIVERRRGAMLRGDVRDDLHDPPVRVLYGDSRPFDGIQRGEKRHCHGPVVAHAAGVSRGDSAPAWRAGRRRQAWR